MTHLNCCHQVMPGKKNYLASFPCDRFRLTFSSSICCCFSDIKKNERIYFKGVCVSIKSGYRYRDLEFKSGYILIISFLIKSLRIEPCVVEHNN